VHHPLLVKVRETRPDSVDPVTPDTRGDREVESTRLLRRLCEIPSFHVFHREEVGVPLPAEIEHLDEVWVGKGSGEARLA